VTGGDYLTIVLAVESLGAAVFDGATGNYARMFYWLGAVIINVSLLNFK
jgi:hypothetical protein